MTPTVAVRVQL